MSANDCYARANDSYGATTLLTKHGAVRGDRVTLDYRGKSGKQQRVELTDASLARVVRRCHDLPGQALFQYLGDDGTPHQIGSGDVNAYIKAAMGDDYSAKHFRTWGASVIAFETIRASDPTTLTLKTMLVPVAAALGNTPAISRKSYVHPALIAAVASGETAALSATKLPRPTRYLSAAERGLIAFLQSRDYFILMSTPPAFALSCRPCELVWSSRTTPLPFFSWTPPDPLTSVALAANFE